MQLVGSLYLLYFPYCGFILWEACGAGNQHRLHAHPKLASLASLLLACSPPINGLLYGLKSQTLRRSVQNYWRKKATKSELQQVGNSKRERNETLAKMRRVARRTVVIFTVCSYYCPYVPLRSYIYVYGGMRATVNRMLTGDTGENTECRGLQEAFRQRKHFLLPIPALTAKAQRGAIGPRLVQGRG